MAKPDKNSVDTQVAEDKVSTDNQAGNKQNGKKEQKNKKTKKQNVAPKINIAKVSVGELKKVTWPTFGEVVKNTLIVLGIVLVCTLALFLIDRVLSWLYQLLVSGTVTNWWF